MKQFTLRLTTALGLTLAVAGTARANGYEFFAPASTGRPIDLVYVGQIREKGTGNLVREPAYFMVTEKASGMTFPFGNDRPGHYRSPDIGLSVKDLGGTVSANDLEIQLMVSGYKTATITKIPRKITGVVEVNFELEREGTASSGPATGDSPAAADGTAGAGRAQGGDATWVWFLIGGAVVVSIAGAAARTSALRQSTTG